MKNSEFRDLLITAEITKENAEILDDGGQDVSINFEIMPEDFIQFAEKDLVTGDSHGLINALSNAKRAIDCRTDLIIEFMGLVPYTTKKGKFEILNYIGIVAPRIINKIRKARNMLEHEYITPEKEIVENAIDVAILFNAAAKHIFNFFPEVVYIGNSDRGNSKAYRIYNTSIELMYHNNHYNVRTFIDDNPYGETFKIENNCDLYLCISKLYIAAKNMVGQEEAISELLDLCNNT